MGRAEAGGLSAGAPVAFTGQQINTMTKENTPDTSTRLNAAAPELLAACEELMKAEAMQQGERNGYIMGTISQAIDKARDAIAKATAADR